MNINQLYPNLGISKDVLGVTSNSKQVKENYIFVAVKGKKQNGKKYIKEALDKGACLIVTDQLVIGDYNHIRVKNAKEEYIKLLQKFYHYHADIYSVGITGTDGKTTTATLLNNIFNVAKSSAYIGTNGINYLSKNIKTKHTTPIPSLLYEAVSVFKKHNINDLVMEVSSEGIVDGRVDSFKFNGAIFTNLSHEHLNTHKTMNNYLKAKAKLFEMLDENGLAVINSDDKYAKYLFTMTKAKIITYGIESGLYQAKNLQLSLLSSKFDVYYKGCFLSNFEIALFGKYNVYNALACIAYTNELGIDLKYIKKGLIDLKDIEGRFMHYTNKNNITGIVDFAHTPNALENILANLSLFKKGKIISVLGAQGEKDKTKRQDMGKIATTYSDITIFTSEDPKNESLFSILYDLTKELENKEYYLTINRADAIKLASRLAKPNDIVLVTGKGNENFELIKNFKFKHNDYQLLIKALEENK